MTFPVVAPAAAQLRDSRRLRHNWASGLRVRRRPFIPTVRRIPGLMDETTVRPTGSSGSKAEGAATPKEAAPVEHPPSRAVLPVIAIVGRPNVGKSSLFNQFTGTRDAIVADTPGLTRDRRYGTARRHGAAFIVVDTGGLAGESGEIDARVDEQVDRALEEADRILLLTDARAGRTGGDEAIADRIRRLGKPMVLAVNKTDGMDERTALTDFHALGLDRPFPLSAAHGRGLRTLARALVPEAQDLPDGAADAEIHRGAVHIAIIGRPNAGKSTLVNRLLGEERMITHDAPGTTRDSVFVPFERAGRPFVLIDTAGLRRRSRVAEVVEKISAIKALQAIEAAQVAILVLDSFTAIQ